MSELPANPHIQPETDATGRYVHELEAERAAYAQRELEEAAQQADISPAQQQELQTAANKIGEAAAANFDTAKVQQVLATASAREKIRILGEGANQDLGEDSVAARAVRAAAEQDAYAAKTVMDYSRDGGIVDPAQRRALDDSAMEIIDELKAVKPGPDRDQAVISMSNDVISRFEQDLDEGFNGPDLPLKLAEVAPQPPKTWADEVTLLQDLQALEQPVTPEQQAWVASWEQYLVAKYADQPINDETKAALSAEEDEVWYKLFPDAQPNEAPSGHSPEVAAEAEPTSEELGRSVAGSLELFATLDMPYEAKQQYLEAAKERGFTLTGERIQAYEGGGWQTITTRPGSNGEIAQKHASVSSDPFEELLFMPVAPDDSGQDRSDVVQAVYRVGTGKSAERFGATEVGYSYVDGTGRPGNTLTVAFELSPSQARVLAQHAGDQPAYVRNMVEAAILGTGMPPKIWDGKGSPLDRHVQTPLRPPYVEPKAGYRIGISGGDLIGVANYDQNLKNKPPRQR